MKLALGDREAPDATSSNGCEDPWTQPFSDGWPVKVMGRGLRREYPGLSVSRPQPGPRGLVLHVEAPDTPPVQVQILKAEPAESALASAVTAVIDALRTRG